MRVVVPVLGLQRLREICEKMKFYKACDNSLIKFQKEKDKSINPESVDFSKTTVVLGKTGNISSEIVDLASAKLQQMGIDTYVSDIDHLTLSVSKQAVIENPFSDIIIIKVDGISTRNIKPSVIIGCETEKYDSLGVAVASSIGVEKTKIEKGKVISDNINIPTELENEYSKSDYPNRILSVTIVPEIEADTEELATNILNSVIRFSLFSDVEKDRKYYDFSDKQPNWKTIDGSKTAISTNLAIYPIVCHSKIIKSNEKRI